MSRESKRQAAREEQRTSGQASAATEAATEQRTSPAQFLREVRSELRKVAWPSRREVASYTVVVLVTTIVLVAIVWGMDEVIRRAVINTLG
jgi:preprotein translocase subunit SecE